MRLYTYNTTLLGSDDFISLFRRRLFAVEALSAIKFNQSASRESNTLNNIREKCTNRGYPDSKTESIVNIFAEYMTVARLIQAECNAEWAGKPGKVIKEYALKSARAVISKDIKEETLLQSISEYITGLTDPLLDSLTDMEPIGELDVITQSITECFPSIDQARLIQSIYNMTQEIKKLKPLSIHSSDEQQLMIDDTNNMPQEIKKLEPLSVHSSDEQQLIIDDTILDDDDECVIIEPNKEASIVQHSIFGKTKSKPDYENKSFLPGCIMS